MMDYNFTAKIETELDAVENGSKIWHQVVKKFYDKLNPIVMRLSMKKDIVQKNERLLGKSDNNEEIYAVCTKYGPAVKKKINNKYIFAKISEPLTWEKIKLTDAIKLLEYPKIIGQYKGKDVKLHKGQYGLYLSYDKCGTIFKNSFNVYAIFRFYC